MTSSGGVSALSQAAPRRLVIGVDGSGQSKAALRWASFIPGLEAGTELEAVMTWESLAAFGWATMGWAQTASISSVPDACERELASVIDEVYGVNRPARLRLTTREGNAANVLLEVSKDATMLIVGSRGRGGFAGLLLGSVSARCAEHAQCPVLVVHGDGP